MKFRQPPYGRIALPLPVCYVVWYDLVYSMIRPLTAIEIHLRKSILAYMSLMILGFVPEVTKAEVRVAQLDVTTHQTVPGSKITDQYTLSVELVIISNLNDQPGSSQDVFVYETELGTLVSKLNLGKDKTETISKDDFVAPCASSQVGLTKTTYTGEVGVMRMIEGYTVYWNHRDLPEAILNVDPAELTDGITLKAQVPDPADRLTKTPSFSNLINPNQCADGLNRLNMALTDNGVPSSVQFIKVSNGMSSKMGENGGHEKVEASKAQVEAKPLGDVKLDWDEKNHIVEINGGSPGKYLAVAQIKNQNNSTCSSQVLFIFNFK